MLRVAAFVFAAGLATIAPTMPFALPAPAASADDPSQKRDKPSKKERQGTPTGEIKGGKGGSEFRDKAEGRLVKVGVRTGSWVDSVRCTWEEDGIKEDGTNHGGSGGEETVITLEPGEALIQVSGTLLTMDDQTVIGSIGFKTTKRTIEPAGESTDGEKFTLDAPKGQEICGFQGRSSDYLDAIGLVCRPLP